MYGIENTVDFFIIFTNETYIKAKTKDFTYFWFGSAKDIHEKSTPTSIPIERNNSSRLKITLFRSEERRVGKECGS